MSQQKPEYNLKVTPLWETDSGNYKGMKVDAQQFDALQNVEEGGMFFIKIIDPAKRKDEKSPHAYLEFVTAAQLAKFKASVSGNKFKGRAFNGTKKAVDANDDI